MQAGGFALLGERGLPLVDAAGCGKLDGARNLDRRQLANVVLLASVGGVDRAGCSVNNGPPRSGRSRRVGVICPRVYGPNDESKHGVDRAAVCKPKAAGREPSNLASG